MTAFHDRILSAIAGCLLCAAFGLSAQTSEAPGNTDPAEAAQQAASAAADGDLASWVDGTVAALMRDKRLPGLTIAAVSSKGPRLLAGYGYADIEEQRKVDARETLFRIGSISKTFIWTAAMMLADRGALDLDADVNDYLETFAIEPAFGEPVTMRHLMNHTAGFETTLAVFTSTDADPRGLAEVLAATQPGRVRPPGERISYSNWGAALAALVVERASGMPFEEFVRAEILVPLGMERTTQVQPGRLEDEAESRLATGHAFRRGGHTRGRLMQLGPYAPAGGVAASAADMARWMRFHLNRGALEGRRLMSRDAHEEMWSRPFGASEEWPGLAHGFQAFRYRGVDVFGHGGSTGNFQSNMLLVPALDLGVFVSQNSGQDGYAAVSTLTRLVIDRELGAPVEPVMPAPSPTASLDAGSLQEYSGSYRTNRRSFTTMTAAFSMQPTLTVAVGDDGSLIVTLNGKTSRYAPVAGEPDLFEDYYGDRLVFQRDREGRVVSAVDSSGVHSHDRIEITESFPLFIGSVALGALLSITTLLGAWRRWRLRPETTVAGSRAAGAFVIAAVIVLLFLGIAVFALAAVSSLTAANLSEYPPAAVIALSYAAFAVAPAALLALVALVPAWRGSGWEIWRKLHATLFALALVVMALQLWQWRLFGAPYI